MGLKDRMRKALNPERFAALYALKNRLTSWDPRRLQRKARFRRLNRGSGPTEMVVRPGVHLRIDERSREPFEWFCFRSVEMARELDAFRREAASRSSFLDIGACHGIFSLVFAHERPDAHAVAVEPSAIAFEILTENVRLSGLDNVVLKQVACGPAAGSLRMRPVWHHLEALPREGQAPDAVEVPMRSVDDLCSELDLRPDLVKIDVEGYELAVLSGARATLKAHRPPLFLEIHPERLRDLGASSQEVLSLLAGLGYGFVGLEGGTLDRSKVERRVSVFRIVCAVP